MRHAVGKQQDAPPIGSRPEQHLSLVAHALQKLSLASLALRDILGEQQHGCRRVHKCFVVPSNAVDVWEYVTPGRVLYEPHVAEHVRVPELFGQVAQHLSGELVGPEESPVGVHVGRRRRAFQPEPHLVELLQELLGEEAVQVPDALEPRNVGWNVERGRRGRVVVIRIGHAGASTASRRMSAAAVLCQKNFGSELIVSSNESSVVTISVGEGALSLVAHRVAHPS